MKKMLLSVAAMLALSGTGMAQDYFYAVDGDTIKSKEGAYIRLLGIDTPEIHGKCKSEKEKANQAKKYMQVLLDEGQDIKIIGNRSDKYGRLLAKVIVDGQDVSSLMLSAGFARVYDGEKRGSWCD